MKFTSGFDVAHLLPVVYRSVLDGVVLFVGNRKELAGLTSVGEELGAQCVTHLDINEQHKVTHAVGMAYSDFGGAATLSATAGVFFVSPQWLSASAAYCRRVAEVHFPLCGIAPGARFTPRALPFLESSEIVVRLLVHFWNPNRPRSNVDESVSSFYAFCSVCSVVQSRS